MRLGVSEKSVEALSLPVCLPSGWSDLTLVRDSGWLMPITCLERLRATQTIQIQKSTDNVARPLCVLFGVLFHLLCLLTTTLRSGREEVASIPSR